MLVASEARNFGCCKTMHRIAAWPSHCSAFSLLPPSSPVLPQHVATLTMFGLLCSFIVSTFDLNIACFLSVRMAGPLKLSSVALLYSFVYILNLLATLISLPPLFFSLSLYLQGVATGKYHGAILTNSEPWESKALQAGRKSGDLLAPIIYCPELHFSEFASAIADMKNSVAVSTHYSTKKREEN